MRSARPSQDRKFGCPKCEKKFFTPKDLRRHENTHLGIREHVCLSCHTRFGRKDHLTRHTKKSCSVLRGQHFHNNHNHHHQNHHHHNHHNHHHHHHHTSHLHHLSNHQQQPLVTQLPASQHQQHLQQQQQQPQPQHQHQDQQSPPSSLENYLQHRHFQYQQQQQGASDTATTATTTTSTTTSTTNNNNNTDSLLLAQSQIQHQQPQPHQQHHHPQLSPQTLLQPQFQAHYDNFCTTPGPQAFQQYQVTSSTTSDFYNVL